MRLLSRAIAFTGLAALAVASPGASTAAVSAPSLPSAAAPAAGLPATTTAVPIVETFNRPAGTNITLAGRGYGHGRGMSQWGAYGAATKGLTWQQIMSFYYPGTAQVSQGNPGLRVRLSALGTASTRVVSQSGLRLNDGTTTTPLPTSTAQWRVVPDGGGLTLQWRAGTGWASSTKWKQWPAPLSFSNSSTQTLRAVLPSEAQREYRGTIRTHANGSATLPVNILSTEAYLWSVVPSEMPASWAPHAVRSQAVAARTYATYDREQAGSRLYDTCDSTSCQVYQGVRDYSSAGTVTREWEHPNATAAVSATAGMVLKYNGAAAFTQFSASNGGWTVAGSQPYLVAKPDPYDGVVGGTSNPNSWTTTFPISRIEAAYPSIGTFRSLEIPARDGRGQWAGRTLTVRVVGSSSSTTVSGASFRFALRLRSEWWAMASAPAASTRTFPKDLTSDGLADLMAVDSSGRLKVLKRQSGSLGFTTVTGTSGGWGSFGLVAALGTWDSDNRGDVVARGADGSSLYVYRGGNTGALTQGAVRIGTGWNTRNKIIPTGDFDGDRYTDFLARGTDGAMVFYGGTGAGSIRTSRVIGAGWQQFSHIFSPGDFTGDAKADVLAVRASDGMIFLYQGTGTGGLLSARQLSLTDFRIYTAVWSVGDVTGDGLGDIVARRAGTGELLVRPGNGRSGFGSPISLGTGWAGYTKWAQ